jgi:hypothetical protein
MLKSSILLIFIVLAISVTSLFGFQSGEKLTFVVSYTGINAAEATLEVNDMMFNREIPCYRITSNAKTYPFFDTFFKVRDTVESIWDKERQVSLQFTKNLNEGKYRQYRVTTYDPETQTGLYRRWQFKENKFKDKEIPIADNTQDIFSAFYLTRMQNLTVGKDLYIKCCTDGKNYTTRVIVHRIEKINTIFGQKECLVIEPKLAGEAIFKQTGQILIWVTNDAYKIPVQLESKIAVGKFRARLSDAVNVPYQKK